jgi:hypothetical protein
MKKQLIFFTALLLAVVMVSHKTNAQQYKLRQSTSLMGMKTESTIYVKGMRKRTEPGGMMGMPASPTTIEQCDLQRTIKLNDKKKLYYIEPFSKETEEVIDEEVKPAAKTKPVPQKPAAITTPQKGGVITMWYNITDTGERKKMNGFTARHIWTSQKIKPSPEACSMKDSIIIKTDGWYIDLPQFNCPVRYRPARMPVNPSERSQPDCKDKFITRRSGKGKLGFPLIETTTIKMGTGNASMNEFTTALETVEMTTGKLDSMLFEIPPDYTQTTNEEDLQEKFDMGDMMKNAKNKAKDFAAQVPALTEQKKTGIIRIGVYVPKGEEQVQTTSLQQSLVLTLQDDKIEAIAITSEEDAKKYNCDYSLTTEFSKIKQGNKVGGLLKAIKNSDPNAASSFNIEAKLILVSLSDGSTRLEPKVSGKYEGKIDEAVRKALEEGGRQIVKGLK